MLRTGCRNFAGETPHFGCSVGIVGPSEQVDEEGVELQGVETEGGESMVGVEVEAEAEGVGVCDERPEEGVSDSRSTLSVYSRR